MFLLSLDPHLHMLTVSVTGNKLLDAWHASTATRPKFNQGEAVAFIYQKSNPLNMSDHLIYCLWTVEWKLLINASTFHFKASIGLLYNIHVQWNYLFSSR